MKGQKTYRDIWTKVTKTKIFHPNYTKFLKICTHLFFNYLFDTSVSWRTFVTIIDDFVWLTKWWRNVFGRSELFLFAYSRAFASGADRGLGARRADRWDEVQGQWCGANQVVIQWVAVGRESPAQNPRHEFRWRWEDKVQLWVHDLFAFSRFTSALDDQFLRDFWWRLPVRRRWRAFLPIGNQGAPSGEKTPTDIDKQNSHRLRSFSRSSINIFSFLLSSFNHLTILKTLQILSIFQQFTQMPKIWTRNRIWTEKLKNNQLKLILKFSSIIHCLPISFRCHFLGICGFIFGINLAPFWQCMLENRKWVRCRQMTIQSSITISFYSTFMHFRGEVGEPWDTD